jgi:hypothetical protein
MLSWRFRGSQTNKSSEKGSCYCRKDVRSHDPRCFDSDKCKVLQLETSSNIDPLVAGQSGQRCYLLSSLISLILRDNWRLKFQPLTLNQTTLFEGPSHPVSSCHYNQTHFKGSYTLNLEDEVVLYSLQQRPLLEDAAGSSIYKVSLNGPLSILIP